MPAAASRAADAVLSLVPPTEKKKGLINKARRFVDSLASAPAEIAHYRWMTFLSAATKRRLYTRGFQEALAGSDVYRPVQDALARFKGDDLLNRQLYADLSVYLADDILVKVDRMSMATSLETRAPFLDVRMMELAFSMPGELKIRNGTRKYILKRALDGLVPPAILHRKKEGFSIPMKNWLRGELRPLMTELLSEDRVRARGLVEPSEVARLIREHCDQRENHAHVLFSLMGAGAVGTSTGAGVAPRSAVRGSWVRQSAGSVVAAEGALFRNNGLPCGGQEPLDTRVGGVCSRSYHATSQDPATHVGLRRESRRTQVEGLHLPIDLRSAPAQFARHEDGRRSRGFLPGMSTCARAGAGGSVRRPEVTAISARTALDNLCPGHLT